MIETAFSIVLVFFFVIFLITVVLPLLVRFVLPVALIVGALAWVYFAVPELFEMTIDPYRYDGTFGIPVWVDVLTTIVLWFFCLYPSGLALWFASLFFRSDG